MSNHALMCAWASCLWFGTLQYCLISGRLYDSILILQPPIQLMVRLNVCSTNMHWFGIYSEDKKRICDDNYMRPGRATMNRQPRDSAKLELRAHRTTPHNTFMAQHGLNSTPHPRRSMPQP